MAKKTLVLKFGGTSVADRKAIESVCEIIGSCSSERVCVVVSALGTTGRYGKVTDALIELKGPANRKKMLSELKARHMNLIDDCIRDKKYSAPAKEAIEGLVSEIEICLENKSCAVECFGEKMSVQVLYYVLRERGVDVSYVNAFDVIHFINRNPYFQKIGEACATVSERLDAGKVVITEGFVANENGVMTCMNRGGSDQTATLIGEAIDADEVIIYSDQNGILTADPRVVKSARTVKEISYPEAEEMAGHGAKIIYPKILEPLKNSSIPIIIKNTFNPAHAGTRIVPVAKDKGIKCITMVEQVHTSVHNPAMIGTEGFLAKLFSDIGTDIDVIISGNPIVGYTTSGMAGDVEKLREFGQIRQQKVHTIAIVGEEVEDNPRALSKISACLAKLKLEIEFISHDRQSAAIYFGIKENEKTGRLLNMLHEELIG